MDSTRLCISIIGNTIFERLHGDINTAASLNFLFSPASPDRDSLTFLTKCVHVVLYLPRVLFPFTFPSMHPSRHIT